MRAYMLGCHAIPLGGCLLRSEIGGYDHTSDDAMQHRLSPMMHCSKQLMLLCDMA